jgi:hypothetical protein
MGCLGAFAARRARCLSRSSAANAPTGFAWPNGKLVTGWPSGWRWKSTGSQPQRNQLPRSRRPSPRLLVNTAPTGTAVIVGVDPASEVLKDAYPEEEPYLLRADPQTPPQEYLDRSIAVEPDVLLESRIWEQLVDKREAGSTADLSVLWNELRGLTPDP